MSSSSPNSTPSNPFATPTADISSMAPNRVITPPIVSPITPFTSAQEYDSLNGEEPEEDITFNLMVVASALYTIPLAIAREVSPIWALAIERDAVDDGDGFGLNIRYMDVESDPFCLLLTKILQWYNTWECVAIVNRIFRSSLDEIESGVGRRTVLLLKAVVLFRVFKINLPYVEETFINELELQVPEFVEGKKEWTDMYAEFERTLRKATVDVRDVEKMLKKALTEA